MARIINDSMKLTGSMGNMTFTQDEKGTIVKIKNHKVDKTKMDIAAHENMKEMGVASQAAKELRTVFLKESLVVSDRYFSGRLSGAMRKVVGVGEGKRGERILDIRKNGDMLKGFEFINARPLVTAIGGIREMPVLNGERNELAWTSPTLNRQEQLTAPEGATHFKFVFGAATVGNYKYDPERNIYLSLAPKFRNVCTFVDSDFISLNQAIIAPVILGLKLSEVAIPEVVAVVCVVGVSFYRNVNGELLGIKDASGMRVLGVF